MITNLYCPSCGTANSADQKFCRSCGLNLLKTVESLVEQRSDDSAAARRQAHAKLEKFGNFAFTGLSIVGVLAILGILYAIVTKMILSGTQPAVGALLAAFVVFASLALTYVFWRESLTDNEKTGRGADQAVPEPSTEPVLLPGDRPFEPVSVVDETTRRLKITNDLSRKER